MPSASAAGMTTTAMATASMTTAAMATSAASGGSSMDSARKQDRYGRNGQEMEFRHHTLLKRPERQEVAQPDERASQRVRSAKVPRQAGPAYG
jgi:hypothetical protein